VYKLNLKFSELTLGIIGVGHVGAKVAQAAKALGMRVLLNDPPRADREGMDAFTTLDRLLSESDIVTCHTPLTKEAPYPTRHLASDHFFSRMKTGAIFINTSRGAVVDTQALIKAKFLQFSANSKFPTGLQNSKFPTFNYILDVWEGEPHINTSLLADAFIGTPHIAGYSSDGKANGTAAIVHEFCTFFGIESLKDWYPEAIPPPPMPTLFSIDGTGKSHEQIIYEAVTHTYPIWNDSDLLKKSPATFEEQRGGYWIRREFKNFTIQPDDIPTKTLESRQMIGFKCFSLPLNDWG
jgi:erythronate-4-phosphate dehydrogenase